jgi:hypothetical protein
MFKTVSITLLSIIGVTSAIEFGSCPKPASLQSDFVKNQFDVTKFANGGTFYELGYKDMTQPRMCDCIRSIKTYLPDNNQIFDDFTLRCAGKPQFSSLYFNLKDGDGQPSERGVMYGEWVQGGLKVPLTFPNTIVDAKVHPITGEYEWVIEFQCVEKSNVIFFYGLNLYAKDNINPAVLPEMLSAVRARGLGHFLDEGNEVKVVDHSTCEYPPPIVPSPVAIGLSPAAAEPTVSSMESEADDHLFLNEIISSTLRGNVDVSE